MKKLVVVMLVIALVAGGILFLGTRLDGIVAGLIETHGSAATQTPVRVGGVNIELREAAGTITRLTVGNPDGFPGNAIEMEGFSIRLDPSTLTSDTVVINEITVSGAALNILQEGGRNNLKALLDNLDRTPAATEDEEEGGKRIIIDRFTLEGASARLSAPDLDEDRNIELPTIVVRDIGRASNGATGAQVARQVLDPVIERALRSAAADSVRDRIGDAAKGLLDAISGEDEEPR